MDQRAAAIPVAHPGTPDATFESLYRSSRDDLFAYVATLLQDRGGAEDVVALAFERAYRKRRTFRADRGSSRAWLFGIARNAALDELRRRSRTASLVGDVADDGGAPPLESADRALRRVAIRSAIALLTARERELVALKFHGGLANAEIAGVLGISETNAGTQLHRTIQKLRKACDEDA
jgi:RNA polymerase sigma-70 factor, ECF subfamily